MTPSAVLLHGFAGTGRGLDGVRAALAGSAAEVLTPDLPGHGERGDERPVSFDACVDAVLGQAPGRFVLCGYSMGGRVALHIALAAPERVSALVLVASTAGIADDTEREQRRVADEELARAIEADGVEAFAARWVAQPLFAGDPPQLLPAWLQDIRRNTPSGLAAALRGIGTGAMRPLWDDLAQLQMPVSLLAGERDAKFRALALELAARVPQATLAVVPGAGHGLPREAPAAVAEAVSTALGLSAR